MDEWKGEGTQADEIIYLTDGQMNFNQRQRTGDSLSMDKAIRAKLF